MPWYVAWAPTPPNGRLGGIYSLPHTSSRWRESNSFLLTGTPNSPVHTERPLFIVWCPATCADRWGLQQSTVGSDLYSDCLVLQPESACCGPLCTDCPGVPPDSPMHTGQDIVHYWCATRALADCPLHGFLCCFLGLLLFLSLRLLSSFYVFF
jgi:hypothetical protein